MTSVWNFREINDDASCWFLADSWISFPHVFSRHRHRLQFSGTQQNLLLWNQSSQTTAITLSIDHAFRRGQAEPNTLWTRRSMISTRSTSSRNLNDRATAPETRSTDLRKKWSCHWRTKNKSLLEFLGVKVYSAIDFPTDRLYHIKMRNSYIVESPWYELYNDNEFFIIIWYNNKHLALGLS